MAYLNERGGLQSHMLFQVIVISGLKQIGVGCAEIETFIFFFCWSAVLFKGKEKQKLISKERNHLISAEACFNF